MTDKGAIFPMFYLPPVSWFSGLYQHPENALLERAEHFVKQTYRNRAHVCSPNGMLSLTVPITKGAKNHTIIKDVKISYDFDWQRLHWQSLQACYRSSAYFEFYEDDFARFYHTPAKAVFLFDFNNDLLQLVLKNLKIKTSLMFTDDYERIYPGREDFRSAINPKQPGMPQQKAYFQVFEERQGFLPDLSIIDLLFNQGPQSKNYL